MHLGVLGSGHGTHLAAAKVIALLWHPPWTCLGTAVLPACMRLLTHARRHVGGEQVHPCRMRLLLAWSRCRWHATTLARVARPLPLAPLNLTDHGLDLLDCAILPACFWPTCRFIRRVVCHRGLESAGLLHASRRTTVERLCCVLLLLLGSQEDELLLLNLLLQTGHGRGLVLERAAQLLQLPQSLFSILLHVLPLLCHLMLQRCRTFPLLLLRRVCRRHLGLERLDVAVEGSQLEQRLVSLRRSQQLLGSCLLHLCAASLQLVFQSLDGLLLLCEQAVEIIHPPEHQALFCLDALNLLAPSCLHILHCRAIRLHRALGNQDAVGGLAREHARGDEGGETDTRAQHHDEQTCHSLVRQEVPLLNLILPRTGALNQHVAERLPSPTQACAGRL